MATLAAAAVSLRAKLTAYLRLYRYHVEPTSSYMYLLIDDATKTAAAVDPYDPKKIIEAADKEGVKLGDHLITTHHHQDHAGGNNEFKSTFTSATVYGGSEDVEGLTKQVKHGDTFKIGQDVDVSCHATPCHTQDSICFFAEDKKTGQRAVFTGDTLFISGCGRFFEGTPSEMHKALNSTLAALPDDTKVYCGHEYTQANVAFSLSVDPDNKAIQSLKAFCESPGPPTARWSGDEKKMATGQFTIGDEKTHNVFMRLHSDAVRNKTGADDAVHAMGQLREMKVRRTLESQRTWTKRLQNNFKG